MLIQTSSNTIDLRGKRAATALMMLEAELTEKGSNGAVFVIHGVGTGALRREVHQYLKAEPCVARYALEESSNGGCTVVHLQS
jgi:DNA mismatch repair protein MutS2